LRFSFQTLLFLSVSSLATASACAATVTTYTNPATWQGAASGILAINFEGLAPTNNFVTYTGATGLTLNNVQFIGYTSGGSSLINVLDTNMSSFYNFGTGGALMQDAVRPLAASPLPYIHIVLPANITAFGMDLFTASPSQMTYTITVAGTPYTVPTNALPNVAFWGVTSDTPISTIDLKLLDAAFNGGSHAFVDNFKFGTAQAPPAETPEAATFLLIGSGLIGLVALKRKTTNC
jgi:hypothetical protein